MGGTLACWLAQHHPEIKGIAVVNPLVHPTAEECRDLIQGMLADGTEVIDGIGSDIAMEGRLRPPTPAPRWPPPSPCSKGSTPSPPGSVTSGARPCC